MSASMYWRPVPHKPDGEYIEDAVRYLLAQRIWGSYSDSTQPYELGENDIIYLQGLRDAGVKGADELLDAIQKYGAVEVWIAR